jgi:hypothetical protein
LNRKIYWRISIALRGSRPVTLYVKRVYAGWRRQYADPAYDIELSESERKEIFDTVHALARAVANFLGVPVRSEVPPEISQAVADA